MTTRHLMAAVLGAIAMFIWSFIAHTILPLGEIGVRQVPDEDTFIDALKTRIGDDRGLYIFPGLGVGPNATRQEKHDAMQRAMEKGNNGPSGLLIYHSLRPFVFSRRLTIQFGTHLAEAILAVFLLSLTRLVSFGGRVGFVLVAGILAAITTNIPYLNWYGFPRRYTASAMFIEVVGFFLLGLVAALVLRRNASAQPGP